MPHQKAAQALQLKQQQPAQFFLDNCQLAEKQAQR
jgi:hypothetical protein